MKSAVRSPSSAEGSIEDHPRPAVAVDVAAFTLVDSQLRVLLVRRARSPHRGSWALPGSLLRVGSKVEESLDACARRVVEAKTGLSPSTVYLEQLYTFGEPRRDPRMRVLSVTYLALVPPDLAGRVRASPTVDEIQWRALPLRESKGLAFDHDAILRQALERLRGKLDYSPIGFALVGESFSIRELRLVHELILGTPQDPGNFRRRFQRMIDEGLVVPAQGRRQTASRPAQVYRLARAAAQVLP